MPARANVFNLNANTATMTTAKNTTVCERLAPKNTPSIAAAIPAQIRLLAQGRDSRFHAPSKNGIVITIVPEYAWALTKNAGIRNAVLPATSRLLYINWVTGLCGKNLSSPVKYSVTPIPSVTRLNAAKNMASSSNSSASKRAPIRRKGNRSVLPRSPTN